MVNKLVNPQLPTSRTPPPNHSHVKNHEKRLEDELLQLQKDILRIGDSGRVKFGDLFDDPQVEQYYEALVGTLKCAKKRGIINFKGQMLLKGMHDDVIITLVREDQEDAVVQETTTSCRSTSTSHAAPTPKKRTPPRWLKKSVTPNDKEMETSPVTETTSEQKSTLPKTPPRRSLPRGDSETEKSTSTTKNGNLQRTPPRWTRKSVTPKSTEQAQSSRATATTPLSSIQQTPPRKLSNTRMAAGLQSSSPIRQTPPRPPSFMRTPPRNLSIPTMASVESNNKKAQTASPAGRSPHRRNEHSSLKIPPIFTSSDDEAEGGYSTPPRPSRNASGAWSDSETDLWERKKRQETLLLNLTREGLVDPQQHPTACPQQLDLLGSNSEHSPRRRFRQPKNNISERWTSLFSTANRTDAMGDAKHSASAERRPLVAKNLSTTTTMATPPRPQLRTQLQTENDALQQNKSPTPKRSSKSSCTKSVQSPGNVSTKHGGVTPTQHSEVPSMVSSDGKVSAPKRSKHKFRASMVESTRVASSSPWMRRTESERVLPTTTAASSISLKMEREVEQLLLDIVRLASDDEKTSVSFGDLFNDDVVQNTYEALVGTLRSAKKRGKVSYQGQFLLKGVHDDVMIQIVS